MILFLMTSLTENKKEKFNSKELESCIKGIASGDEASFEALYRRTSAAVYAYALSVLKNKFDAEDIMHDSYLNIYRFSVKYKSCGKPMAWIFTIVKNLCLKKISAQNRISELNEAREYAEEKSFDNIETDIVLKHYFDVLTAEERETVVLHAVWGFKHRETAARLNIPLSTALSRYNRAIKKLNSAIESESADK